MNSNIDKKSFKDMAYLTIRADIISCKLEPGKSLNELELAEMLGVSRTPVREALHLLQRDNLVKLVPQKGVFVSEVTIKMVNEAFALRELIEPEIARLATPLIPLEILLDLKQKFDIVDELPSQKLKQLDSIFHSTLAEYCGNSLLIQIMTNLCAQMDRIRNMSCKTDQRLKKAASEHREIISIMLARDAEKASETMRLHIRNSLRQA